MDHALHGAGMEEMMPAAGPGTGHEDEFGMAGAGFGDDLLVRTAKADAEAGGLLVTEKKAGEAGQG